MEEIESGLELDLQPTLSPPFVEDFTCSPLKELTSSPSSVESFITSPHKAADTLLKPSIRAVDIRESPIPHKVDHFMDEFQFKPIVEDDMDCRAQEQCVPSTSPPRISPALRYASCSRYVRNVFRDVTNTQEPPRKIARKISFDQSSSAVDECLKAERENLKIAHQSLFEASHGASDVQMQHRKQNGKHVL